MYGDKLVLRETMKRTWLVQRLQKPCCISIKGKDVSNVFSFGCGFRNGGLTDEAMALLKGVFSFDYMGSAEFEWGAVPQALSFLATQKLVCGTVDIDSKSPVYYICPKPYEGEVKKRILVIDTWDTKEYVGLHTYFERKNSNKLKGYESVGWLEIDNGYMFFVDADMYEKTKKLFGIEVANETKS